MLDCEVGRLHDDAEVVYGLEPTIGDESEIVKCVANEDEKQLERVLHKRKMRAMVRTAGTIDLRYVDLEVRRGSFFGQRRNMRCAFTAKTRTPVTGR